MFSSRGLFKNVPCPGKHECSLPNCLFSHEAVPSQDHANSNQVYDPESVRTVSPPPAKRRRLNSGGSGYERQKHPASNSISNEAVSNHDHAQLPVLPLQSKHAASQVSSSNTKVNGSGPTVAKDPGGAARAKDKQLQSVTRSVSPPKTTRLQNNEPSSAKPYRKTINTRGLAPRPVDHPPAKFELRHSFLKKLHKQIEEANTRYREDFPDRPELFLSKEELETQAMDEEEQIAKAYPTLDVYKINLAQRLSFYTPKKMSAQVWEQTIQKAWLTDPNAPVEPPPKKELVKVTSGLDSIEKDIHVVKLLRTGLHQHAKHGYVIKQPSDKAIAEARKLREGPFGNTETCDRCGSRFQVFPGRNKSGDLTSHGPCTYHWARISRTSSTSSAKYPCCGQQSSAQGCTQAPHHVFKVTDPARLAILLPFQETPKHSDSKSRGPVVFDCEMSYTTFGLELVRLTALAWPTHKTLLDVLVRPLGEILDMNTRFSGVTYEMLHDAKDYGIAARPKYTPDEPLQRVASPAAAREFLFDLLDPDTPLIGHAIENDLNACRIIHPFVIDTVLLYPHPRGLPVRYKLKDLARMYLDRHVQTSGDDGHDSKEDSVATGDLVLKAVAEKWVELKRKGWWWDEGEKLMPPRGKSAL